MFGNIALQAINDIELVIVDGLRFASLDGSAYSIPEFTEGQAPETR
jgi:hypothetical protein